MNADEMNWLLQTIEEPQTAKRFVHAQYEHRRVSSRVVADLAREHGWTDYPEIQVVAATAVSMAYTTAEQAFSKMPEEQL
jgi:hypothetical protein